MSLCRIYKTHLFLDWNHILLVFRNAKINKRNIISFFTCTVEILLEISPTSFFVTVKYISSIIQIYFEYIFRIAIWRFSSNENFKYIRYIYLCLNYIWNLFCSIQLCKYIAVNKNISSRLYVQKSKLQQSCFELYKAYKLW